MNIISSVNAWLDFIGVQTYSERE